MPNDTLPLKLEVLTDKSVYKLGEPITVKVILKNTSNDKLTLTFRSAKIFDIELLDRNKKLIKRWSEGKLFAQMINDLTLEPNETIRREITWDIFKEISTISPDEFYIKASLEPFQGKVDSGPVKIRVEK